MSEEMSRKLATVQLLTLNPILQLSGFATPSCGATDFATLHLLNQSRQQSISVCSLSSQSFCCFDLCIEKLVESGNQFFRWTLFYDISHFVSKTYRSNCSKRSWARKHDIHYQPFHCCAASLWKEPICHHARVCCSALHGIQWHGKCWREWKLFALHIDILDFVVGIVIIFESALQRFDSEFPGFTALRQLKQEASCPVNW